jgi:hypothetical protein
MMLFSVPLCLCVSLLLAGCATTRQYRNRIGPERNCKAHTEAQRH